MPNVENKESVKHVLGVLNAHLPDLKKGLIKNRYNHSDASKVIGDSLGNSSAVNHDAFQEAEKYFHLAESKYYSSDDKVIQRYLKEVGDEIKSIRRTIYPMRNLEKTLINASLFMFIIAGIFFLTPSLTGGVVGATKSSTNVIGITLMIIGIIGFFIYKFSEK